MIYILIKKKFIKNIFFFIYVVWRGMKKKIWNVFKIELVLKMLFNEEECYLKKIWIDII